MKPLRVPAVSKTWPVLNRYDEGHLRRIAMPLGGIGTGTVSLGGRGNLQDWEIGNVPARGFAFSSGMALGPVFLLRTETAAGQVAMKALEGPIDEADYEESWGCGVTNASLPRFRGAEFAAAYPLAQVMLSDPAMPLEVRLEAFNPLVPADADASGIPIAALRYVLINRSGKAVRATVAGSIPNLIGADGSEQVAHGDGSPYFDKLCRDNRNTLRAGRGLSGVYLSTDRPDRTIRQWGTLALATTARSGVTRRTKLLDQGQGWGDALIDLWDDLHDDGRLTERDVATTAAPHAALAVSVTVPPRSEKAVTFMIGWHFPNRRTWTPRSNRRPLAPGEVDEEIIGNYYTTQYADAWEVLERTAGRLKRLEEATVRFVGSLCRSPLPQAVKEAALNNVSTLRTQTVFRTPDGHLFGFEGVRDHVGSCHGSCTHVWNYEQTTAMLFGELARTMREVEFLHATDEEGLMSFRVNLPLSRAREWGMAAADGQMGTIMRLYREWQLCGDDEWLARLWPQARKAMEFSWIPGGWDADHDGVMEGCQHNTMDVEYFGPNPQMGAWYLGALRACEEMAGRLDEDDFARACRGMYENGRRYMDEKLFNGEYYEHHVQPVKDAGKIAPGLAVGMGAKNLAAPEWQLGSGCLVDQMAGQLVAHVSGLGYILDPAHVRAALASVMKYNFREDFYDTLNQYRSYALNDEQGLLMATWPRGNRPAQPFPYCYEVMTGFEYTAAAGMVYEGLTAEGLRCVEAIRDRFDGWKRNPYNETECGYHYVRAMAAWAMVPALSGFHYSAVEKSVEFAPADTDGEMFWSNGYAWGTCRQKRRGKKTELTLTVLYGTLTLKTLTLVSHGSVEFPAPRTIRAGKSVMVTFGRK
jgi:non-lysosomal glucosylceramidase